MNRVIMYFSTKITPSGYSNNVDIFDTSNQQWKTASLSQTRHSLSAASTNKNAYFVGGILDGFSTPSDVVDVYNGNSWTTTHLSTARFRPIVIGIADKLYVTGGYDGEGESISSVISYK